ncbi:MAG: T9SS type A sorting domain-containing protein [Bacteroidota bacterium]
MQPRGRFFIFFVIVFLLRLDGYSENDTLLKPGYANIAILLVDYDTHKFEGGNLSYYSCTACSNDSLPFSRSVVWHTADDFEIAFKMDLEPDTVFHATTFWMGIGQIYYPMAYSLYDPFVHSNTHVQKPTDIEYVDKLGLTTNDPLLVSQADSAWAVIDSLRISKVFSDNGFKSSIYLYAPTIGVFDPKVAKWVIFLYCQEKSNSIGEFPGNVNLYSYPNPVINAITLNAAIRHSTATSYKLFTVSGKLVQQGSLVNSGRQIDVTSLPGGLYLLKLFDKKGNSVFTQKIIKE